MPAWGEAQYVIDELKEEIKKNRYAPEEVGAVCEIHWGGA